MDRDSRDKGREFVLNTCSKGEHGDSVTRPLLLRLCQFLHKGCHFSRVVYLFSGKIFKGIFYHYTIKQQILVFELKEKWPDCKQLLLIFIYVVFIKNKLLGNMVFTLKFRSYPIIQPSPCTYSVPGYFIANKIL